jgi:hypothetical protein
MDERVVIAPGTVWPLVRWFVVGAVAGTAYFAAVRASAARLAEGRPRVAVVLGVLRFGALALLLGFAARSGAPALLAAALGVLAARPMVMRWLGGPR